MYTPWNVIILFILLIIGMFVLSYYFPLIVLSIDAIALIYLIYEAWKAPHIGDNDGLS